MMKKKINLGWLILFFQTTGIALSFAQEDIRDVKGPIEIPVNMKMWLIIGIAGALMGMGTAIYFFLKNRKKKMVVVILPDPWDVAYKELSTLNQTDLIEKGLFKEYFSRLSDIMRKYFEAQLNIKAPEMTTEEFLIVLARLPTQQLAAHNEALSREGTGGFILSRSSLQLKESQKDSLKEFLTRCDLVKFAKFPTTSIEADQGFQLVKSLIDDTKPKEMGGVK